ncbi:hypothetical protein AT1G49225 [Arabidopsis thaliana]|uniref:Uncharacterized protein n=1 Tax=Arabidopsis thaliana TaxID=3702 RepID=A0A1P8ATQ1_ARATH|nr:uncharacterized protein AT1G49225 [Arabidopsis thaliana]ANM59997.1 hypothetical protein AT1G49225 [Arabidopsis thaliana]|eukprot:NP_001322312.1 hypothetical protein AT1G49225 [Arabidopsis thaliana]
MWWNLKSFVDFVRGNMDEDEKSEQTERSSKLKLVIHRSSGAIMTITISVGSRGAIVTITISVGSRGTIVTITISVGSAMLLKPLVYATNMEPVVTLGEQPELFTGNKIRQTNDTLFVKPWQVHLR